MKVVLIGDIHVYRRYIPPWHLMGKTLLGQLNVWFNRKRRFDLQQMAPLLRRVASLNPEFLLFSGDLTTTAYMPEFLDAAAMLEPVLKQFPAVMVPGNHDHYTGFAVWLRRMERAFPGVMPDRFPYVRRLSPAWNLLALNSAIPRTFTSRGKVGKRQLDEAKKAIAALPPDQGLVVLSHYTIGKPPHMRPSRWAHQLSDLDAMIDLLASHKSRVIFIHGHVHYPWRWHPDHPRLGHLIDINSGAPCLVTKEHPYGQGFWEIELPDSAQDPVVTRHHAYNSATADAKPGPDGWVVRNLD